MRRRSGSPGRSACRCVSRSSSSERATRQCGSRTSGDCMALPLRQGRHSPAVSEGIPSGEPWDPSRRPGGFDAGRVTRITLGKTVWQTDVREESGMAPVIAGVAARAGVSRTTVSHALSGKRPVSPRVLKRVQEAMAELGYVPRRAAQTLKSGASQIAGLIVQDGAAGRGDAARGDRRRPADRGTRGGRGPDGGLHLRHVGPLGPGGTHC
ncbi:LacI family DNA-binding transcriptional regulator [Streptomyces sp. B22F1]|uniref:LacI family DNA-binding transcriptional regulator n=1 Tax=Streptomyces sp. B22F1 TaxID=3153566 RepID=UPI00325CB788